MSHEFTLGEWIESLAHADEERSKKMDYEKAWWKLKNLIEDRLDTLVPDPVEYSRHPEKFDYEMALRSVDHLMTELEKDYTEEKE